MLEEETTADVLWAVALGYALGLITTIVVMNIFEAAQPALLYIVPGLLLTTFIRAGVCRRSRENLYFQEKVGSASGEIAVASHED